jgi:fatty-acyl-CoA synthase
MTYQLNLTQSHFPKQTDIPFDEITIGDQLRKTASRLPINPALVETEENGDLGRRWTYSELLVDSDQLAMALSTRFKPGERVVVWANNVPEWVLLEYACAMAGLVLVTANPSYQEEELRFVLEHSGACGLFLVKSFRGNPMFEIANRALVGLETVREVTDMEDKKALFSRVSAQTDLPNVKPQDVAQIQYTSGTTGVPKGVVLRHVAVLNSAKFFAGSAKINQESIWANFVPTFHTAGCVASVLGALNAGCVMYLVKAFEPEGLLRLIEEQKISTFFAVPTMVLSAIEAQERKPRDLSSMKMIVSGGALVPPELVCSATQTFNCHFECVYGMTETSPVIAQTFATDTIQDTCDTVGQAMPHVSVSIRDPKTNDVVPVGQVGEVCVSGPTVMKGYHDDPIATEQTIDSDGWLHSGDLGVMDERGYFSISGRLKDMIIRGGENLFPTEIENVLLEHPSILEVAVIGVPDKKFGEIVACFVRCTEGYSLNIQELHGFCRKRISPQKTPAVWHQVTEFPLTGSGKIRKVTLKQDFLDGLYKTV